ncbi:hypothetical protein L2U69_15235 [Zavarzinia compransoris]|uniref:hypothetical protein n=1 Tax=Zavarzinia marina TaxID=2911065 RepID=UPI001F3084B4|nr:hypothetical protein [Zavarzinia marina]MCF4167005.1 hypothetical protein [Zavarzinia marina]
MNADSCSMLFKHGLLAVLVALISGFFLIFTMIGEISFSPLPFGIPIEMPGTAAGWRTVHLGMMLNGFMALLFGAVLRHLEFDGNAPKRVAWFTVIAVWGNFCFYLFGMFAPNHGVTMGGNRLGEGNLAGALAFLPALVGAVTLIVAVVVMLRGRIVRR